MQRSDMATSDELLMIFARSISSKVAALSDLELTPGQRTRIRESISDDIKKCTNFILPEVSRAAREKAERLGIDLFSKNWHDQPSFDPKRRIFHFEHVLPVSAIRNRCEEIRTEEGIYGLLRIRLRVAWILKSEDVKLTGLGFRSKRSDPDEAYREAKIQLLIRTGINQDSPC
jgi:hypothetical protein